MTFFHHLILTFKNTVQLPWQAGSFQQLVNWVGTSATTTHGQQVGILLGTSEVQSDQSDHPCTTWNTKRWSRYFTVNQFATKRSVQPKVHGKYWSNCGIGLQGARAPTFSAETRSRCRGSRLWAPSCVNFVVFPVIRCDQFHGEFNETFEAYHPRSLKSQIEGQLVQTCEMAPDSSQVMRISKQTNSTKLGSAVGSPRARAKACHRSVSLTCSG